MKHKRRDIFKLLERDCVNPATTDIIKDYINRLVETNQKQPNRRLKNRGKYGGIPTRIDTLKVGTKFYVYNGAWHGEIVQKDGVNHISIDGHLVKITEGSTLDIGITT